MLVVAHRGASAVAPEHTFPAYDLALAMGADALELDVHMTADGVLVVFHDATLERVTGRPGFVADTTLAELKALDAGAWFGPRWHGQRVPALDEVLHRYGSSTRYFVEMKDPELYPGMERELSKTIRAYGVAGRTEVMSFSAQGLRRMREVDHGLPLVRLFPPGGARDLVATARYARGVGLWFEDVDDDVVAAAGSLGLEVVAYTVDSPDDMPALASVGADAVVTNHADRVPALTTAAALR